MTSNNNNNKNNKGKYSLPRALSLRRQTGTVTDNKVTDNKVTDNNVPEYIEEESSPLDDDVFNVLLPPSTQAEARKPIHYTKNDVVIVSNSIEPPPLKTHGQKAANKASKKQDKIKDANLKLNAVVKIPRVKHTRRKAKASAGASGASQAQSQSKHNKTVKKLKKPRIPI